VANSERLLLWAFSVVRAATWAQLAAVSAVNWGAFGYPAAVVGLVGVAGVESAAVIGLGRARGTVAGPLLPAIDVCANAVMLVAMNSLLRLAADPYTSNVFYPYAVGSMLLVGFALTRIAAVVLVSTAVAGAYAVSTVWWFRYDVLLPQNLLAFWGFAVIGWVVSRHARRLSQALDRVSCEAAQRAAELAQKREHNRMLQERERAFRDLHDGVLQTLEALSRPGLVADAWVESQVAQEAVRLRRLISDEMRDPATDLVSALGELQQEVAGAGLVVEVNAAGAGDVPLPPGTTTVLVRAVREALVNVVKHAATTRAIVRARRSGAGIDVTVVDHGRGFAPDRVPPGVGLTRSVAARVQEIGGTAEVESAPGEGTRVHIWVPLHQAPQPTERNGPESTERNGPESTERNGPEGIERG